MAPPNRVFHGPRQGWAKGLFSGALLCLTLLAIHGCESEAPLLGPGADPHLDGGTDALPLSDSMVIDAHRQDMAWPPLPPRAEGQTCAPAPVDFDVLPALTARRTMTNIDTSGAVAFLQPAFAWDWWIAYSDGRVDRAEVGPSAGVPLNVVQWPSRIRDMVLAPNLGTSGRLYLSVTEGTGFAVWAVDVVDARETNRERLLNADGPGWLAMHPQGVAHVVTHEGVVSVGTGEVVRAGDGLGRCVFDGDDLRCFGDDPLHCETTEGVFYRGSEAPVLWGAFVYPCGEELRALEWIDEAWVDRSILQHESALTGAFVDRLGRLHGRDIGGRVQRLRLANPNHALGWPDTITATGCLDQNTEPSPELIPYEVNAPLWSDGTLKRRWVVLPPGQTITVANHGEWALPTGSVLVKQFDLRDATGGIQPIETRLMTRWPFGWSFHTYRWREDGLDADLLDGERSSYRTVNTPDGPFDYLFPSRTTCTACHRGQSASVIGISTVQLTAGPAGTGQLDRLLAAEVIDRLPIAAPVPDPDDETQVLHNRARATLHAQCAHCHQPGGWSPPDLDLDLRWSTPWAQTRLCDVPTQYPAFFVPGDLRLSPGAPDESAVLTRQTITGAGRMPVGTALLDPRVDTVLRPWIRGMEDCRLPDDAEAAPE